MSVVTPEQSLLLCCCATSELTAVDFPGSFYWCQLFTKNHTAYLTRIQNVWIGCLCLNYRRDCCKKDSQIAQPKSVAQLTTIIRSLTWKFASSFNRADLDNNLRYCFQFYRSDQSSQPTNCIWTMKQWAWCHMKPTRIYKIVLNECHLFITIFTIYLHFGVCGLILVKPWSKS